MAKHNKIYFYLMLITLISFFGFLFVFETNSTETLGRYRKTILMAIWFLAIAVFGFYGCKSGREKWMTRIWVLQYAIAFIFSACYLGLYFYLADFPMNIKSVMASIRNFYLTPAPFAFLLLMRLIAKNKNPQSVASGIS